MGAMGYEGLRQGLPDRVTPGAASFRTDAKSVRAWADSLPLANASATARLLYNALRETNGLRIDAASRLNLLETLRMPVQQIADTVDRQIVGSSFPLPPQKRQLGDIAQDFQRELATGYRIALTEMCGTEGKVPFLRGRPVALALQRMIAHLGAQLAKAYLVYSNPPAGVWQTLHDAFAFARATSLEDKPIEDPVLCGAMLTPRESYAHVLLLAMSNPYQFAQREIHDAYRATQVWANQCRIVAQVVDQGVHAVSLDTDRGPGYLQDERRSAGATVVGFDTHALEQNLERELQMVQGVSGPVSFRLKNAPAISVSVDLIKRLIASWRPPAGRHVTRLPGMYVVETLVGLSSLHYHLAGRVDFESFARAGRTGSSQITLSDRADGVANWAAGHAEGAHEVFCARVLDHTRYGYRIEWESVEAVRARIGEIVGLAMPDEDPDYQDWMVGVIRWMRIDSMGRVEAGIELIAREARAAALRSIDANGVAKSPIRAIRLQPLEDGEHAVDDYTVVAPSVVETSAARLELALAPLRWTDFDRHEVAELAEFRVLEHTGTNVRIAPPTVDSAPAHRDDVPDPEYARVAG